MDSVRENLPPELVRRLSRELGALATDPPEGVKVLLNEENITDVQALIAGPPATPYAGGSFRIKLCLSKDFPASPPKGLFLTKVFHPNVATPSGEICVNTLKKDWTPDLGIKHILLVVKCLLIQPNPESALNEEAGKLIMDDYEAFARKARMFTKVHAMPKVPSFLPNPAHAHPTQGSEEGGSKGAAKRAEAKTKTGNETKKRLKRL